MLGVKKLHEEDYAHRDIKPENVMMCKNGYIKLIDFGVSKALEAGQVTSTNVTTALYTAPEQIKSLSYTRNIDWWAVGILGYEMLIG